VLGAYNAPAEDLIYWNMGRWRSRSSDGLVESVGSVAEAFVAAGAARNMAGQGSSQKPRIHTYIPIHRLSLDPEILSSDYKDRFAASVKSLATVQTRIEGEAVLERGFLSSTVAFGVPWLEPPAEAVGFIGHAISADDIQPESSVGLMFFDKDLIKKRGLGLPWEVHQWINKEPNRGTATALWVDTIRTETKILFVSSCYMSDIFLSLWEMPEDAALVVPEQMNAFTALNGGAEAWRSIAEGLGRGQTIGQAVSAWNTAHPPFAYRIVGNQHARISLN